MSETFYIDDVEITVFEWSIGRRRGDFIDFRAEDPKHSNVLILARVGVSLLPQDPLPSGCDRTCDVEYYVALDKDEKLWGVAQNLRGVTTIHPRSTVHDLSIIEAIKEILGDM